MIIRDNYCQFCTKTYVVTPYLNRLDVMVQMRGHNIMVSMRNKKSNPEIFLLSRSVVMKDTEEILTSLCK